MLKCDVARQPLLVEPREDLAVEYKTWLDLTTTEHKAIIAKAAIALANHGGGYIVVGFDEQEEQLISVNRPAELAVIQQDAVNAAIQRYASPEFHCELYSVPNPANQIIHPVIVVPGNTTEPVMCIRDCNGVIARNRCYIRKPGPRSEEPQTGEEWRALLRRCVLAGREDMLEAIRSIVLGRVEPAPLRPNATEELHAFCVAAHARWSELINDLPEGNMARMPLGYYEMGFSLVNGEPAPSLVDLQTRLEVARRIRLTGWACFLSLGTQEWAPYPHEDFVEAWVGRPVQRERNFGDAAHADFWRASRDGKLYTIRGYNEDGVPNQIAPGEGFDVTLPVWRVAEGLLFASRLAETFDGTEAVAVECHFTGLNNRYLTSLSGGRMLFDDRICRTDAIRLSGQVTLDQIRDNLTEFIHELLRPLYERFDFFPLSNELVEAELSRLRRRA